MLSDEMPRSLRSCYGEIAVALEGLASCYDRKEPCLEHAQRTLSSLSLTPMSKIFQMGLHEFLSDFISGNNRLASEIASTYHFND